MAMAVDQGRAKLYPDVLEHNSQALRRMGIVQRPSYNLSRAKLQSEDLERDNSLESRSIK